MPQFLAAIGANILAGVGVGVYLGATAGLAIAITVGAVAVVGFGYSTYNALRGPRVHDSGDGGASSSSQQLLVRSTTEPRKIVYGEAVVSGPIVFMNTSTGSGTLPNGALSIVAALTGHEIDSFQGFFLDDKFVPIADVDTAGDGDVDDDTTSHGYGPFNSQPVLFLRGHTGATGQTVDTMLDSEFSSWTSNHRGRGVAYLYARLDRSPDSEVWDEGAPGNISALIRGKKVYDPRLDSTFTGSWGTGSGSHRVATPSTWAYSTNPALCLADYLIDADLGAAIPSAKIDYNDVAVAADACDASVAIPTAATQARFTCNGVLSCLDNHVENIEKILSSMAGTLRKYGGLYHISAGVWPSSSSFALDESHLVGPFTYRPQPERTERFNAVRGLYFDPDRNYKESQYLAVEDSTLQSGRDDGETIWKELDLPLTNDEYTAQRLAMRTLEQASRPGILVFPTGYNGINIAPGDHGTVSIDALGWVNKSFRCIGLSHIDMVGVELTLKEDDSNAYDDPLEGEYGTRTAAGAITFPAFQREATAVGWVADVEGKPAGIRGVGSIADRSQLDFTSQGQLRIASSPDTSVAYGFPAIPVNDSIEYRIVIQYVGSASSVDGLLLRMYEKDSALATGKTHVGESSGVENVVDAKTSDVTIVSGGPISATKVQESFTYTPTAGTRFATLAIGLTTPTTAGVVLGVDWVALTARGSNVDLLPGVQRPADMIDLLPNVAEVLISSQPADGTLVIASISYSGGGTLVDYSPITDVSWENDTGESIDVVLRQTAKVALSASDSLIGRKLAMRWSLNGGSSWSYDGADADNANITGTSPDYQPRATQRTVTVAAGETIDVESIVVMVIPDPTTGDPADVRYRGLSLSIEAKLR